MECPFVVNQKVVCLETWGWPWFEGPVKNKVYTIRDIKVYPLGIGLLFYEIKNPSFQFKDGFGEPHFRYEYFRPAVDLLAEFLVRASRKKPRQKTKENV